MAGRGSVWLGKTLFGAFSVLCICVLALAQEPSQEKPPSAEPAKPPGKIPAPADLNDPAKRTALIDKMIADFDLTPHSAQPIPDNPPPHEGALINLPYVVEPPDLVVVEVLESLPGRPVSGERLVRPDGTISLGFYGDVQVRGLTLQQVKVAIIKQMRKYVQDQQLGLISIEEPDDEFFPMNDAAAPHAPGSGRNPFDPDQAPEPQKPKLPPDAPANQPPGKTEKAKAQQSPFGAPTDEPPGTPFGNWTLVPPQESTHVYIDVSAYNTMNYYIAGDVAVPGRIPCTGKETVLDALNFAGGLLPTAEPKDIRLIRPARGGKPAKVLKVDLEAIQENGDVTSNYQIFPGDRLVVNRNEVARMTIEIDRLAGPIESIAHSIQSEASMHRSLQVASPDHSDQLHDDLVDFWLKQLSRQGDLKFDEKSLREALIRKLKQTPPAQKPAAK